MLEKRAEAKIKNMWINTVAVLRGARGRPQPPRLSSTLISGCHVPSASSVGWCAEARERGSSLLHARRTSRAAKKKKMSRIGQEREKQEGRKATGRHGLRPQPFRTSTQISFIPQVGLSLKTL